MKKFSISILILCLFVSTIALVACGSDDDPSEGNKPGSPSSKCIAKIIEEEGNSIYESVLSYDSQGRVVKITGTRSSAGTSSQSEKTYQYGEAVIVTKEEESGTYSNGQSFTHTENHSFTLKNGLIVKDEEKQGSSSTMSTYSYNGNNYLTSISTSGSNVESNTKVLTWTDGCLTKLDERTFTYSTIPWQKGFPVYLKGSNTDPYLFSMGYYGNTPKYLPSKYTTSQNTGWSYEYTLNGNFITQVTITPTTVDNKRDVSIITIIWE